MLVTESAATDDSNKSRTLATCPSSSGITKQQSARLHLAVNAGRLGYNYQPTTTARTSRAESTRYSSPAYLTSVPPYLE